MNEVRYDKQWMIQNEAKLQALFPEFWTHKSDIEWQDIFTKLKAYGFNLNSARDFGMAIGFFEALGIMKRDGDLFVRNSHSVFKIPTIH